MRNSFVAGVKHLRRCFMSNRAAFTEIYVSGGFNGEPRASGTGSDLIQTGLVRQSLPLMFQELKVTSVLDLPCGDFNWMKEVVLDGVQYIGADIVPELIARHQRQYANERREFRSLDIVRDRIPRVDLVLCRDCFVHLRFRDIRSAIQQIRASKSTYVLLTHFPAVTHNTDVKTVWSWRPLNMQLAPFNFPAPMRVINEGCTEAAGRYADKSLALWRVGEL